MENSNNVWIKPELFNLNTNLTFDPGLTCAEQNKLGGPNVDALTASNAPCSS
jgi:hypothetical protein